MKLVALLLVVLPLRAFAASELKTVPHVDISCYLGSWFSIARNPLPFEDGCVCSRQNLSALPDGQIRVLNTCNDKTATGPLRSIEGTATNDDPATNARYTVDFGLPQKGQYWIIGLDADYRFAVVSEPSRRALYILSKTPQLAPAVYAEALEIAAKQVDTSKLVLTNQTGCVYP